MEITIRNANENDLDFLVEAIYYAEKSGTEIFSYSTIFNLSEEEIKQILRNIIAENEGYCELSLDSFLVAEIDNKLVGTVAGWVEAMDEIPSALAKANMLFSNLPSQAIENAISLNKILSEIHIERTEHALQLESIYTNKDFRGKGIAKLLIDKHIELAKQKDKTVKIAQIILADNNSSAINTYKNAGFELTLHPKTENKEILKYLPSNGKLLMEKKI